MMSKVKFKACKYLDFSDNYAAKKELISNYGDTKVCWDRPVLDSSYPALVQFCKQCGRLNHPEACLREQDKHCSSYEEYEHEVTLTKHADKEVTK